MKSTTPCLLYSQPAPAELVRSLLRISAYLTPHAQPQSSLILSRLPYPRLASIPISSLFQCNTSAQTASQAPHQQRGLHAQILYLSLACVSGETLHEAGPTEMKWRTRDSSRTIGLDAWGATIDEKKGLVDVESL